MHTGIRTILSLFILAVLFSLSALHGQTDTLNKDLLATESPQKKLDIIFKYYDKLGREDTTTAKKLLAESLVIGTQLGDSIYLGRIYYMYGTFYYTQNRFEKSTDFFKKASHYLKSDQKRLADTYTYIGINYDERSLFQKGLSYYLKALKIYEGISDSNGICMTYINLAGEYLNQTNEPKSKYYTQKALDLAIAINDSSSFPYCYMNLGIFEKKQGNYEKALEYYIKLETIALEWNDKYLLSTVYTNIANIFEKMDQNQKALGFHLKAVSVAEEYDQKTGLSHIYNNLGNAYLKVGNIEKASYYVNKALDLANETGSLERQLASLLSLADIYSAMNDYKKAYSLKSHAYSLRDTIMNEETIKMMNELDTKYQTEKKEQQIHTLNVEKKLKDAEIEKNRKDAEKQKLILYASFLVIILILFFSVMVYRQYRQKRKANIILAQKNAEIQHKNEEISAQRDEIQAQRDMATEQRDMIAEQKAKITDSILYASRIQNAILPPLQILTGILPQHFILFKPRDIVSGDFYWAHKFEDTTYVAVADCTGHGVPGAFMSMLGMAFLNEVFAKYHNPKPSEILDYLRKNVKRALHQTGKAGENKDGMDIALIKITAENSSFKLEYAGANNSIYIINPDNQEDITELKPDKMPIGIHAITDRNFTDHEVPLNKSTMIYLFTDGYADQFGGESGKKFMYKPFKKLLGSIADQPLSDQHKVLEYTIEKWMKNTDQIDDILIMGIRLI